MTIRWASARTFILEASVCQRPTTSRTILTTIYHDLTKASRFLEFDGRFLRFLVPRLLQQPLQRFSSSFALPAPLSIGIDERTNSLVLYCTTAMKDNIKSLVDELDKGAKDTTRTVKIVSIQGIDPTLLEQAITAISGCASQNNGRRTSSSSIG